VRKLRLRTHVGAAAVLGIPETAALPSRTYRATRR